MATGIAQTETVVDAAALAAKSIAEASGLTNLEAIATMVTQLDSRLGQLEQAAPAVQALYDDVKTALAGIQNVLPEGFVERVEGFFGRHFPQHAAPAAPAAGVTKAG